MPHLRRASEPSRAALPWSERRWPARASREWTRRPRKPPSGFPEKPRGSRTVAFFAALRRISAATTNAARAWFDEGARRGAVVAPLPQVLCLAQLALSVIEQGDWDAGIAFDGPRPSPGRPLRARFVPKRRARTGGQRAGGVASRPRRRRAGANCADPPACWMRVVNFPSWYEAEIRVVLAHAAMRLDDPNSARRRSHRGGSLPGGGSRAAPALASWVRRASSSVDVSAAAANGHSGLTPAELRTLQYLPTHYSFREIGEQLVVSVNTVRSQAQAVYRKLGASTRREAVERAQKRGLIETLSEPPTAVKGMRNG